MNVLGIETSCDETSAAVLRVTADPLPRFQVLASLVASQADLHARWGGVVPEVASRKHVERTLPILHETLAAAHLTLQDIDGVAVTNRPGLVGALLVGVTAAKSLAFALRKPIVGVHHLTGHLYANFLSDPALTFPFLCLLVSGGHTELIAVREENDLHSLGRTRDDAAGECFDKCARLMGLPYPGGPQIEILAAQGNPAAVRFPRAWLGDSLDFSFSGLKTSVLRFMAEDSGKTSLPDVAASFQAAVVEVLVQKTLRAAQQENLAVVALGGGVAANRTLQAAMRTACAKAGRHFITPIPEYCTDNAAMIAAAGAMRLLRGESDDFTFDTLATQPLATAS